MRQHEIPFGMVIGELMRPYMKQLKKRISESGLDITFEQLGLLHAISTKMDDVFQQDMADMLCKNKSGILRFTDILEAKRYVVRSHDPNDRRKNILSVTTKGHEVLEKVMGIDFAMAESFTEGIECADMDAFYRVIEAIKIKMEEQD